MHFTPPWTRMDRVLERHGNVCNKYPDGPPVLWRSGRTARGSVSSRRPQETPWGGPSFQTQATSGTSALPLLFVLFSSQGELVWQIHLTNNSKNQRFISKAESPSSHLRPLDTGKVPWVWWERVHGCRVRGAQRKRERRLCDSPEPSVIVEAITTCCE